MKTYHYYGKIRISDGWNSAKEDDIDGFMDLSDFPRSSDYPAIKSRILEDALGKVDGKKELILHSFTLVGDR